ncbi:metallophosphoesterase [Hydrogenophaga sp. PAMC20947]|uniref:metallophosphoesterase n=1 Tax=Hydrogenophaga sp. PAMC20947 TaxID=2565558 RepID=UPI00109DE014|nr:metallophosphoesterase [Hydrogenophaga sp. PAMC20947]QCB47903.1 metallophosphoesterase [Hydrogenophaga sp. PAMC20947]
MGLVQTLPDGPLDIVGDIHGEFEALCALLEHLGYDENGQHAQGRTLVFVGDLCDRGPDSPAVFSLAERLIHAGRAVAVLGNHEVNLLRQDPKEGAGWFFDERVDRDQSKYAPFARPTESERERIVAFVSTLPVALERSDLRVVHAAWLQQHIDAVRDMPVEAFRQTYDAWEQLATDIASNTDLGERMQAEVEDWPWGVEDRERRPPFLHARAEHEVNKQTLNPLKVLTCGVERTGKQTFYAGGKWRFVDRMAWWDEYDQAIPVVVGHYWRQLNPVDRTNLGKENTDLFEDISPLHWHGKHHNVFCADFSVGGRWAARKSGGVLHHDFKLAALRWPERVLQFDDGSSKTTEGFQASAGVA